MRRIVYILTLLLAFSMSCKNTREAVDDMSQRAVAASYKNTRITVDSLLVINHPKINTVYKNKGYVTLWHSEEDRRALLEAIEDIEPDGLVPEDYNLAAIKEFEAKTTTSYEETVAHDILLTDTFNKLASHLFRGKVDPSEVYPDWDLKPKTLDLEKLLTTALKEGRIKESLNDCRPRHAIYKSLRNGFKYVNSLPDDTGLEEISYSKAIHLNEIDSIVVSKVRKRLAYWGDLALQDTTGNVYERSVADAVKKFQQRHGIPQNGLIDSLTVSQLNVTRQERLEQLMVNLERWKWFAYDLGENAVLVNIPDYQLAMLQNNDTVEVHKVIVGKVDRRTPVLQSKFYSIAINPTWTVPPTIIREDLTPSAIEDPDYFTKNNMTIYDHKDRRIDPYIWDFTKAERYKYVQGPGPKNALGEIKFNFGNKRNVYLHDTNNRTLFRKNQRALSSGCVRVENPQKLAAHFLKGDRKNELSEEKINELIKRGQTVTIGIKKSIHVHQLYWTAWMDKNGLQFRPDIYNLDNALYRKLITRTVSMPAYSSLKDDK